MRASDALDVNSPYAYLLLCSDFAETSLIAECAGEIVGFVGAYQPPTRHTAIFVWQILVAETGRGRGLGTRMLTALLDSVAPRGVRFLEATVTQSNVASRSLFEGFARNHGVSFHEELAFSADLFPDDHEPEIRLIIGPFPDDARRE